MTKDAFIGILSASVTGFIFGFPILYSYFSKFYWEKGIFPPVMLNRAANRYEAIINIAVHLILNDKNEYKQKQQVLQRFLYSEFPGIKGNMADSLSSAIFQRTTIHSTGKWLQKKTRNQSDLQRYMQLMFNIAAADNVIGRREENLLYEISDVFKLDRTLVKSWIDTQRRRESEKFVSQNKSATRINSRKRFFEILGVSEHADEAAIKSAYRTLAKKYHPDTHQHSTTRTSLEAKAKFIEIQEAYEALTGN